jgi:amphi-Trp domain-containing protein
MTAHPRCAQSACHVSESKSGRRERLSRQQAAERLTDVAYALITGGSLQLDGDRKVTLPVTDEVVLKLETKSRDDEFELELELTWSSAPPPF